MRIALINGPNLNLLGQREPEIYGRETLQDLENMARRHAQSLGFEIECYQSNNEGHLIDALHRARLRCQGVVFNPAGYTHTSVALRDAITAIGIPVIEVHLSNLHKREEFRQVMLTTGACVGQISGLGLVGYEVALTALFKLLKGIVPRAAAVGAASVGVIAPLAVAPVAAAAAAPEARGAEAESESERDKRRRRGRRGGRNRRRDGELTTDGDKNDENATESTEEVSTEREDVTARYANLKGATVRRGLDVLAEDGDEPEAAPATGGSVRFSDAEEESGTPEKISVISVEPTPRPTPTVVERPAAKIHDSKAAAPAPKVDAPAPKMEAPRSEPSRRPEPLYGRPIRTATPEPEPAPAVAQPELAIEPAPEAPTPAPTEVEPIVEAEATPVAAEAEATEAAGEEEENATGEARPRKTSRRGRPRKSEPTKATKPAASRPKKTPRSSK
jgi:3-dehydroquinate dehydratase-2